MCFSSMTIQEPGETCSKISALQCFIHLMNPTRTLAMNWAQSYPNFLFFSFFFSITEEDCGSAKYDIQSSWILKDQKILCCLHFALLFLKSCCCRLTEFLPSYSVTLGISHTHFLSNPDSSFSSIVQPLCISLVYIHSDFLVYSPLTLLLI